MDLVDTHCHLFMAPLSEDPDAALGRAREAGVRRVIVPAYDLASWDAVAGLVGRPGVHAALGLHPWRADEPLDPGALASRLAETSAVAVGEIGLDFKIPDADPARQLRVLEAQVALAVDLDLPVLLHCRGAFEELAHLLARFGPRLRGVFHAFSRGPELAERFLGLGLHLAFGGGVTRPGARARRALARVPADRLLLETDAPSIGLADVPPEEVEPRHVREIAEAVAALTDETPETIADRTTANAVALFGLD